MECGLLFLNGCATQNKVMDMIKLFTIFFFNQRICGVSFKRIDNDPENKCQRNFRKNLKIGLNHFLWPPITYLYGKKNSKGLAWSIWPRISHLYIRVVRVKNFFFFISLITFIVKERSCEFPKNKKKVRSFSRP